VRTEPTHRCADVLVVFEGPRRVIWNRGGCQGGPQIGPQSWVPAGLWPTAEQAAEVADHIGGGGRLFVVLEEAPAVVSLLAEEFAQAAPALVALADPADRDEPVVDVRVPVLDWLPGSLRERGLRFLASSQAVMDRNPAALLPRLLLEEETGGDPVRFARRVPPAGNALGHLAPVLDRVFAGRCACSGADVAATEGGACVARVAAFPQLITS
jgi:hypothetical protein